MKWTELQTVEQIRDYGTFTIHYEIENNQIILKLGAWEEVPEDNILNFDYFKNIDDIKKFSFFGGNLTNQLIDQIINDIEKIKISKKLNNF